LKTDLHIGVFGLGFVGITTALGFAEKGYSVKGFDVDRERLETIADGIVPFMEPGLDAALQKHIEKKFAVAQSAIDTAKESDVMFFCVGTPGGKGGKADLSPLFSALDSVVPVLRDGKFRVCIIKSTVPPGTTKDEVLPYLKSKGLENGEGFAIANNPEFLREGKCWDDFINPDRIVCGVGDSRAAALLRTLYSPFNAPVYIVTYNTGEFIKYLSNTLLATMISFSNEMSVIADSIGGIDTGQAFRILHEDKRLRGSGIASYVYPGCGYGGYCLPKDTQAFAEQAKAHNAEPHILTEVIARNNEMPKFFATKIEALAGKDECIGILGLSFKPNSDDVRDSPAAKIISLLLQAGFTKIAVYDPAANSRFAGLYHFPELVYCSSEDELCRQSAVIAAVAAWPQFRKLPQLYPGKRWVDCRYFLEMPQTERELTE